MDGNSVAGAFSVFFWLLICVGGLFALVSSAFWIWMLVDCAVHEPSTGNEKVIWLLIILFTHFVGALLYLLIERPKHRAPGQPLL